MQADGDSCPILYPDGVKRRIYHHLYGYPPNLCISELHARAPAFYNCSRAWTHSAWPCRRGRTGKPRARSRRQFHGTGGQCLRKQAARPGLCPVGIRRQNPGADRSALPDQPPISVLPGRADANTLPAEPLSVLPAGAKGLRAVFGIYPAPKGRFIDRPVHQASDPEWQSMPPADRL